MSLRGVCPTLGCAGRLIPAPTDDDEHYRALYRRTAPVSLTAREHTAQWTGLEASDIQQRFLAGEVNVLSCSTTFELGVDAGECAHQASHRARRARPDAEARVRDGPREIAREVQDRKSVV